jgi:hypothetical protein
VEAGRQPVSYSWIWENFRCWQNRWHWTSQVSCISQRIPDLARRHGNSGRCATENDEARGYPHHNESLWDRAQGRHAKSIGSRWPGFSRFQSNLSVLNSGVGDGNRTRNVRSHSPVLCRLSYSHRVATIITTRAECRQKRFTKWRHFSCQSLQWVEVSKCSSFESAMPSQYGNKATFFESRLASWSLTLLPRNSASIQ